MITRMIFRMITSDHISAKKYSENVKRLEKNLCLVCVISVSQTDLALTY